MINVMAKQESPIKLVSRTRDKWKNKNRPKSIADNAIALAYIMWQLALNGAKNLHLEDFRYDTDAQRVGVAEEYLALLVHLSDRLMCDALDHAQRNEFVSTAALAAARHVQRNKEEIMGRGDYRGPFLEKINRRANEYASCTLAQDEPGYQMLRTIGAHVQDIMGSDQTNKWVIDQVMEIDAPAMFASLRKSLNNLCELPEDK